MKIYENLNGRKTSGVTTKNELNQRRIEREIAEKIEKEKWSLGQIVKEIEKLEKELNNPNCKNKEETEIRLNYLQNIISDSSSRMKKGESVNVVKKNTETGKFDKKQEINKNLGKNKDLYGRIR